MCEMPRSRLIAWMDGELDDAGAAAVEQHAQGCDRCARQVREIRVLSRNVAAYCAVVGGERRRSARWIPAAAAAAVLLAAGLAWIGKRPATPGAPSLRMAAAASIAPLPVSTPAPRATSKPARRRRSRSTPVARSQRGEAGVPVVISLDEVLPLGAAPPGAVLVGNLTFDSGGQPSRIRLH